MIVPHSLSLVVRRQRICLYLAIFLLLSSFFLVSCLSFGGGTPAKPGATSTPSHLGLAKLHWCGSPLILFRDEGAPTSVTAGTATAIATGTATATAGSTPTAAATPTVSGPRTLTDWSQIEPNLGFTVYLPVTLPRDTCLVSAFGTLHDPIFGGSFTIGYLLPDHSSISISEAPLRSQGQDFLCSPSSGGSQPPGTPKAGTPAPSPSPTQTPTQTCSGARDTTYIVFSARGSTADLKQFFDGLQTNVDWVPSS